MPTFYIKTDEPSFETKMAKQLIQMGWKQSSKMPVDLIFLSGNATFYKQKFDTKRSGLISLLWGNSHARISNKATFNEVFKGESFVPDADTIQQGKELPELPNRFLKILKPVTGWYGSGIRVVSNKKQVTDWLSENSKYDEWTLQDYIRNPALIDGYKFNLRIHLIVFNKPYEVYLQNTGEYSYAKEQYVKGEWTNPDIHDTHVYVKDDEERKFFPTVLPDDWTPRIATRAMNGIRNAVHTIFTKENEFKAECSRACATGSPTSCLAT
jgi:hypothetical protein